jgi:membrane associated rhomboid family serine protease
MEQNDKENSIDSTETPPPVLEKEPAEWTPTFFQGAFALLGIPIPLGPQRFKQPARITWIFLLLMLAGTFGPLLDSEQYAQFGFITGRPLFSDFKTFFTAIFIHAGILHFLLNAYCLVIFGRMVEYGIGHTRYLAMFLASGMGGNLLVWALRRHPEVPHVGASGAIFGVILFSLLEYRSEKFGIFFFGAWMKVNSLWLLLIFALFQLIGAIESVFETDEISYLTHLGGAATGLVFWLFRSKWKV